MTTSEKKPRCQHHNYIKVKALYYLSKCKDLVTSADIAKAINANPSSIYVLLNRWTRWEYVKRYYGYHDEISRYMYSLAPKGRIYLENLDKWYLYREQAMVEVDYELNRPSWIWGYDREKYHVIQAPYDDFSRDYYTTSDRPAVFYRAVKTEVNDFFKYAREYLGHDVNGDFRIQVRNAILKAVNEVASKQQAATDEDK